MTEMMRRKSYGRGFAGTLRAVGYCGIALTVAACAVAGTDTFKSFNPVNELDAGSDNGGGGGGDSDATQGEPSKPDAGSVKPETGAQCGDGTCNGDETCTTCRVDCGACAPPCGDGTCNGSDTCTSCPGDCGACPPRCGDGMCNGSDTCTSCPGDCGACVPRCGDGMCNGTDTCENCPGDCGACPPPCGELQSGSSLAHGQSITSCDGRFVLTMQADGNLVLYQSQEALWSSNTSGSAGQYVSMQPDGNLVLYDPSKALWSSKTSGNPGAWLALQTDGNLVIYKAAGGAVWTSGTGGR